MFCKFFIVACKGFKKITGGAINMLDAGHLLHHFIGKTYDSAGNEERAEIADHDDQQDDGHESDPVILYMYLPFIIGKRENRDQPVDPRYHPVKCIESNGHGSQDE